MNGRNVFTLTPRKKRSRTHVLYLHGGAYVQGFVKPHWLFLQELIKSSHCTVTAPDYPLAPANTYKETVAMVLNVYKHLIADVHERDLILMGDSSGGGLALAIAQQLRIESVPQPARIILLSPWLDITLSNQEIKNIDRTDPFLGIEGLLKAGKAYAGNTDPRHYLLSPIYGSLQ
ncbi:MAG TPA: alpha/beta hydrolase, partial [Anseongella sp.]|nr:alpha/beta hydrolase [Anseongella sp.]